MSTMIQIRRVIYSRIWWVGLLTAVLVAVLNATIFLIGSSQGAFPETIKIPPMGMPISLPPVLFTSVMGVLGGTVIFAIIGKVSKNPVRLFQILALVVLVLSFAAPLSIPNAPLGLYAALELMHMIAGLITIGSLTRYASLKI